MGPVANSVHDCYNLEGIKFITRIRLRLSHLKEHKFKDNFPDCFNPLCNCGHDIASTPHFLLHCPLYSNERRPILSTLNK